MGFDTGPIDALFAKRVKIQFTRPDGTPGEVSVTESWLAEQEQNSTMAAVVPVQVADPINGCYEALWKIGRDIDVETVTRRSDPASGCLFAIVVYTDGKPETFLCDKDTWTEAKQKLEGDR